jgi:hypothetical protein
MRIERDRSGFGRHAATLAPAAVHRQVLWWAELHMQEPLFDMLGATYRGLGLDASAEVGVFHRPGRRGKLFVYRLLFWLRRTSAVFGSRP